MYIIIHINYIKASCIDLNISKRPIYYSTNLMTKVNFNIMKYGYYNTIVANISDKFLELSYNKRKVILVGPDDIFRKYITIGSTVTSVDLKLYFS